MGDFIDDGLMKDYFDEAFAQIDIMEENLLILEKDTTNKDAVDALFRAAHTLKGGSATVQMDEITDFTHLLEDVMDEIRDGSITINAYIVDVFLNALDIIKNMVNARNSGSVFKKSYSNAVDSLKKVIELKDQIVIDDSKSPKSKIDEKKAKGKGEAKNIREESGDVIFNDPRFKIGEYELLELHEANSENLPLYKIIVSLDESNPMRTVSGIQIFTALRDIGIVLKTVPEFDEIYSDTFHKKIMYVIATDVNIDKIKDFVTIPDATENVFVTALEAVDSGAIEYVEKKESKIKQKEYIKDEVRKQLSKNEDDEMEDYKDDEEEVKKEIKEEISEDIAKEEDKQSDKIDPEKRVTSTSILRVDSTRIDRLLNLVSEIVINKATYNQIGIQVTDFYENFSLNLSEYKDYLKELFEKIVQQQDRFESDEFVSDIKRDYNRLNSIFDQVFHQLKGIMNKLKSNNQSLDRISSSLQEGVMRVRMVPVKQIFNRFPRLVRDLSRRLNKEVEIVIKGEETEVDKGMIDYLSDPLIHIVRNSIDHGFESPEDRIERGKRRTGTLELSATSEGNIINIFVSDDGKGIDLEKVKKTAIKNGLISDDITLKEQDAFNLIFEPGFSTAAEVTAVSGRGVGLDVVKKNIEKLNGSIRVNSKKGDGTTFSIKIPLTLAIIQGLMIEVSKEIYAIPISSVIESLRIKPSDIKSIDNYEVINVREDVLSLLRLNRLFRFEDKEESDFYFVVILGTASKKLALLVDNILGEEDIVIKPLKDKYTNTPGIAGATILGDGRVSLILNISQLIELGLKQGENVI